MPHNTEYPDQEFPNAWDFPSYVPPGTEGAEGWQDMLGKYENFDYGTIDEPVPMMSMIGKTFGMKNIIQYMKNQFSGKNIGGRVDKYRDLGLGQVNRAFTGAYDKLRGKSAAEGGRGSSAAVAAKVKGVGALAGARADVESKAMGYEDKLRGEAWGRGTGIAGMLESAIRGDEASQRASMQQMLQQMGLKQEGLGAMTGIYGNIAGMEQQNAMNYMQQLWRQYNAEHGGPDSPGWEDYLGQAAGYVIPGF